MEKLKLEDLRKLHLLNLTHKILINKKPQYLHKKMLRFESVRIALPPEIPNF